jgi:hypothetical protein
VAIRDDRCREICPIFIIDTGRSRSLLSLDYDDLGVAHVDGYLGLDFLYQWLPLFDLAGHELALFDLRAHA